MGEVRTALLSGATGGIGNEVATKLVQKDIHVFAGYRSDHDARGLHANTGAEPIRLDVIDDESVSEAVEVVRKHGRLDLLINNAGIIVQGPLELVSEDELIRQFEVNVFGPARLTRALLPALRASKGRIVNVSAVTAQTPMPYLGAISASKAALEALSDALRVEVSPWGINVTIVQPAAAATGIFDKAAAAADEAMTRLDPATRRLYERGLSAVAASMSKQKPSPAGRIADVIVTAATARRPRTRYRAGSGAGLAVTVGRLPDRMRDSVLASNLGLSKGK
jgi:NAD(P)-dependent dehydrogenase (short-subunit alcohol dehydrogenase family)